MKASSILRPWVSAVVLGWAIAGCGGGGSGSSSPPPPPPPTPITATALSPSSAQAGSSALLLSVTGTGFTSTSAVEWNGTALGTNYVSATQLTASVPQADLADPGTVPVTVADPASGLGSAALQFAVTTQISPTVASLAPSSLPAGGAAFQLVVTGTHFLPTATVLWNGRALPTTYQSATQLTAQVAAAQLSSAGSVSVSVENDASAGGTSGASTFTIAASLPLPTLGSLSPTSVAANAAPFTLTFTGTGFTSTTTVSYNGGVVVQPAYVSATELQLPQFSVSFLSGPSVSFRVQDPASGNVGSNALLLSITPALPMAGSLTPSTVTADGGALALTVSGQFFTATSVVYFNGSARPTAFNNSGQLVAQLTATDTVAPGNDTVTIEDPVSGNAPSNPLTLTVQPLPPLGLTQLWPVTVPAGNPNFTLTVLGTGFATSSVVDWNGAALPTTYVSATLLRASVTAAQVASTGSIPVTVVNPPMLGGTSAPLSLSIVAPSIDAVAFGIDAGHSGDMTFKSVTLPAAASWSVNLGGPPSYALIVGGTVYVLASVNGNSQLSALTASTGVVVWGPIALAGPAGLAYDAGTIFVNSGAFASNGVLSALDAATGNPKWSVMIPGEFAGPYPPVAAAGIVYTLEDGELTAFLETDGTKLWGVAVSGTDGAPAVTVDGVYTSAPCTSIDTQPLTGVVVWSVNTGCEGGGGNTPVVAQGVMFSPASPGGGYDGDLYAAETGTQLDSLSGSTGPAVSGSSYYMLNGSTLQGLGVANNQINWSFTGDGMLDTAPIVVNGYVFVGSSGGNLYALDATTGVQVWTKSLGAAIPSYAVSTSLTGLAAGDGWLIVPAGNTITAYLLSNNP